MFPETQALMAQGGSSWVCTQGESILLAVSREEWECAMKEALCGASGKAEKKGGPLWS